MSKSNHPKPQPNLPEVVVFRGKIGEVAQIPQPDGRVFERFRRAPGTRLVIVSPENKVLITKELRQETGATDLRLPGGKVCDSLREYDELRASRADMVKAAIAAATKEAREEVGLDVRNLELITIAKAGATVEWDLYYFVVRDYTVRPGGQELESGEDIEISWMKPGEIVQAIAEERMREWQSVGVLLGKVLPSLRAS